MQNRRWWDVAAVAVAVVVAAISAIAGSLIASDWGAWASTAAFLVFYFAYARWRITAPPSPHDAVAVLGFSVILAVGVAFEPSFAILQTFLYPFAWSIATNTRSAVFANLLVGSAVVVGYTARYGMGGLWNGIAIAALSVMFSLALGLWITRIAEYGEERAQLLSDLQAAQGQLSALSRESGVSSERERLAREIHDTIAQSLTGLVMVAQRARGEVAALEGSERAVESIEMIEALARESLTEARSLVASMAAVPSGSSLAEAIERLAERFQRETGVLVSTTVDAEGLDREREVVLLRCTQEGLANVRKHARAATASVRIESRDDAIVLTISDDGSGLAGVPDGASGGFGLAGMRERVGLVGGHLTVGETPGGGATLTITLPVANAAPAVPASSAAETAGTDAGGGVAASDAQQTGLPSWRNGVTP
ncbi:sensor histidine kinase [Leifsonia sp. YIM 134122]|uniref:Oxygen sensor histidine kinase NreB n=1 Tax=Leifsonia stereocauli TaxID=3134136 RepID=A0ABU9W5J3_9MICO